MTFHEEEKRKKKTTIADKKWILYESNITRIPAMHALTDTILLSSQVHVLLLNKKIIQEILHAVITSMLTIHRRSQKRGPGSPAPPRIEMLPMIKMSQKRLWFLQFLLAFSRIAVHAYNSNQ